MSAPFWTLPVSQWGDHKQDGEHTIDLIRRVFAQMASDLATANAEIVTLHDELAACSNAIGTDSEMRVVDGDLVMVPVDSPLLQRILDLRAAASIEADEARRARAEVAKLNRRLEAVEDWYPGWMTGVGWQDELRRRRHAWECGVVLGEVKSLGSFPSYPPPPGSHRNRFYRENTRTKRQHGLLTWTPVDYRAKTLYVPAKDNGLYR